MKQHHKNFQLFQLIDRKKFNALNEKYDTPQTAFTRLINSAHLTEKQKKDLVDKKSQLNPFEFKKNLEEKLKVFFETQRQVTIRKAA